MRIISRKLALMIGSDRYFTGVQCANGHVHDRYVKGRQCVACLRERKKIWDANNKERRLETARKANRKHYAANKERLKPKLAAIAAARYPAKRAFIDSLKDMPCMDCHGHFPPCAMDFDHRSDKKHQVGNMLGWKKKTILAEVAKCDVVCANCHRIRSAKRGWGRGKA